MTDPQQILRSARHVVVQDYPSGEVPDALTRAGLAVAIYGGPSEADVVSSVLQGDEIVHRTVGRYPERADLFYTYRPLTEVDLIIAEARRLGATALWRQPPLDGDDPDAAAWRERAEAAGLTYVDTPPIEEVARSLSPS